MTPQQVASTGAQLVPLMQPGGAPFFSSAAGVSMQQVPASVTTAGDSTSTSATSSGVTIAGVDAAAKNVTLGTASTHASAQAVLPQTVVAPFQLPSGSTQTPLQTQLALSQMLAPMQGVQPSVVLELNATTNKDGVGEKWNEYILFFYTYICATGSVSLAQHIPFISIMKANVMQTKPLVAITCNISHISAPPWSTLWTTGSQMWEAQTPTPLPPAPLHHCLWSNARTLSPEH